MNKEYKSKVQDALKMVFENVETTVDNDIVLKNESSSFLHMYNQLERLSDAMDADSMGRQKKAAIELASTAILYMVKFL